MLLELANRKSAEPLQDKGAPLPGGEQRRLGCEPEGAEFALVDGRKSTAFPTGGNIEHFRIATSLPHSDPLSNRLSLGTLGQCNLYTVRKSAAEVAALSRVKAHNQFNTPGETYPGYPGMVVREAEGLRVLQSMVWGFPSKFP